MDLQSALEAVGANTIERSFSALVSRATEMVDRSGTPTDLPKFEALPSYIPKAAPTLRRDGVLVLDIGGTSTKIGLRTCKGTDVIWNVLCELTNEKLQGPASIPHSLHRYARGVADSVVSHLIEIGVSRSKIGSCGIVWSNAVTNHRIPNVGITGVVTQRFGYRKNEWFNRDVKDGDDVSRAFIDAFASAGMTIKQTVLTNDTPLTMKALDGADGGMVASTGVNGTIVKTPQELGLGTGTDQVICNAEMGGRFPLESALLSKGDMIESVDGSEKEVPADTIEYLIAGKFLPQIFAEHIIQLAAVGVTQLSGLAAHLSALGIKKFRVFDGRDLALLTLREYESFCERRDQRSLYTPAICELLTSIAAHLVVRGAKLAGLIAWSTISNQVGIKRSFTIALDSRLSREIPLFWNTLRQCVSAIGGHAIQINLKLLEPLHAEGGSVSVPMQGAANAIDCV